MRQASITDKDRVIYVSTTLMPTWNEGSVGLAEGDVSTWLPVDPFIEITLLAAKDRNVFLDRYYKQYHQSGWLIVPKKHENFQWLNDYIDSHYQKDQSFSNSKWTITKYNPK